jgi:hypothetical protein
VSAPRLRPLGIGEILDVSLKIAWRNAGTLVRIVLVVVLPTQLLASIIQMSATSGSRQGTFGGDFRSGMIQAGDVWTYAAGTFAAVIISFLGTQLATAACFRAVADAYLGGRPGWRESLRFAASRFHSILWVVILSWLVIGVGLVLCIAPGVYFLVAYAVALPVLLVEGRKGRRALSRSRELVRGRWWKTAILLFVAFVMVAVIGGVISGLITALVFVGKDSTVVVFLVSALAGTVSALVTTPFSAAYTNILYFDLRVRKEAFDLQLLAEQIGLEPPEGSMLPAEEPQALGPDDQPPFWPPPPGWKPGA